MKNINVFTDMYLLAEDREWECVEETIEFDGKDITRLVEDTAYVYDIEMPEALIEWASVKAEELQEPIMISFFESWERWDGSLEEKEVKEKCTIIDCAPEKEEKEKEKMKNYNLFWSLCWFINSLEMDGDLLPGEDELFRDIAKEFLSKWEKYNNGDAELPEAEAEEAIIEVKLYLSRIWEMFMEEESYYTEEE